MESESGQATVEWVGLVLLLALALGALLSFAAPRVDGRSLGVLIADRITGHQGRSPTARVPRPEALNRSRLTPLRPPKAARGLLAPLRSLRGKRLAQLLKAGTRQAATLNGLVCYLRKSTAKGDTNRWSDDIGDAINCLNPLGGWTGHVGGTDDG